MFFSRVSSTDMIFSRAWFALMRRNLLYRRRNWIASLLEIVLPVAFVSALVGIKAAVQNSDSFLADTVPALLPNSLVTFTPLSFADYLTAIKAARVCRQTKQSDPNAFPFEITGIDNNGFNWQVPFVKCNSYQCEYEGQDASPFCEYGAIGLAPTTSNDEGGQQRAEKFADWLDQTYAVSELRQPLIQFHSSPEAMDEYVTAPTYGTSDSPKIIMGIVFEGNDPSAYHYTLRPNATNFNAPEEANRPATWTMADTSKMFDDFARNDFEVCVSIDGTPRLGPDPFQRSCTIKYAYNGVLTMQRLVHDFILNQTTDTFVDNAGVRFVQFPTESYEQTGFYRTIQETGPLLVTLGLLYSVATIIRYICQEKELRQKELMKMMSVVESDIQWSWFCTFFLFNFLPIAAVTPVSMELYESSDGTYLFYFWFLTFTATTVFSMAVSTFSTKSSRAVLIGLLVFFSGVFMTIAIPVNYREDDGTWIGLISLHPVAAFSYGLQEIGRLEDNGPGLQSNTVGLTDSPSGYTFKHTLSYLVFDSVLWGFVTFYLNRVIPPDYGQALPLWFPFQPSFWCLSREQSPNSAGGEAHAVAEEEEGIPIEPVGESLHQQTLDGENVQIRGLRKTFGDKVAVKGLNLTMYRDQITALLGHNGAGKTTTISMLTGALGATAGTASVLGKDLRIQMASIRQDIGICLQHDCLFPLLTVREHVQFFARLKGLYRTEDTATAERHIDQAIRDVALYEKRHTLSKNLSGGMKRKLSVAMAFCGGSKFVILDEPTSGMDPFARRFTWDLIRQYRQNRVILLTTHFMDEADILGDRIVLLSDGRLRCAGSSLFLKKTYGVGYQLTIERPPRAYAKEEQLLSKALSKDTTIPEVEAIKASSEDTLDTRESSINDAEIEALVASSVSSASVLSNVGTELSFQLPIGASSDFPPMFSKLDTMMDNGKIVSYGVSITTMDEVFIAVARGDSGLKEQVSASKHELLPTDAVDSTVSRVRLESGNLFCRHLSALFLKRAAYFRRDRKAWLCTTVLPSVFVCLGFLVFTYAAPDRQLGPLTLDLRDYNRDVLNVEKNPIQFNQPGSFLCQPGRCAYQKDAIQETATNESYYFCGANVNIGFNRMCTISESDAIMSNFQDDGAFSIPMEVSSVAEVSLFPFLFSCPIGWMVNPSDSPTVTWNDFGRSESCITILLTSSFQASQALAATSNLYQASTYGAILFNHDGSSQVENETFAEAVKAECDATPVDHSYEGHCNHYGGIGYTIQYNFTALHVAPLYQSLADEAIVRHHTGNDAFQIRTTVAPFPITGVEDSFGKAEDAFAAWFLVVLSFPFISGAFASFIVTERQTKAKHLQTVAGVQPAAYWLSSFAWDVLNYQIPLWIMVALMFAFDVDVLTTMNYDIFPGVLLLLFLNGPASAGFVYCISWLFSSASTCNMFVIIFSFLIGMGGPLTMFIMTLLGNEPGSPKPNLLTAVKYVTWILRFTPPFCLGKGLFNAINIELFIFVNQVHTAWSEPVFLYEVIFLACETVVYLSLAIYLDRCSNNPRAVSLWKTVVFLVTFSWLQTGSLDETKDLNTAMTLDEDVKAEEERVAIGNTSGDIIVLNDLTKVYDTGKVALDGISLGIPPGECFGLLGINGAGKTTTLALLTAEIPPTSGDANLLGYSVFNQPEMTRRKIGFCPQFDAHFSNLSGREHCELYACIKGVPREKVKEVAASKLAEVGLSAVDSDRLSSGYSGGMKRRLSLACATIGQPRIVFLDECSTGVDPVARREIWQLVSNMVSGNVNSAAQDRTSVILTTHSMEECEALCPRIGIMTSGRLRCLGSAQHLKNKFGKGYQVELKVHFVTKDDDDYKEVISAVGQSFMDPNDLQSGDTALERMCDVTLSYESVQSTVRGIPEGEFVIQSIDGSTGISIKREALSPSGVTLSRLCAFACSEFRQRNVDKFMKTQFPKHILRERQDTKSRFEIDSEGFRISNIFEIIESNKEALRLADYAVSQTSLEQIFNMHAAEAERLKEGMVDH